MTGFAPLYTERLLLRELTAADIPTVIDYRQQPQVARFQHWRPADVHPILLASRYIPQELDRTGLLLSIILRSTGTLVGDFSVVPMAAQDTCAIGYSLDPRFHGHGYATEAARTMCEWALSQPRFSRVIAAVDTVNKKSIAVLERLGMTRFTMIIPVGSLDRVLPPVWWYQLSRSLS